MSHVIMLLFGWTLGAFLNVWLESMTDMFVFCYLTNSGLKMIFSILGDICYWRIGQHYWKFVMSTTTIQNYILGCTCKAWCLTKNPDWTLLSSLALAGRHWVLAQCARNLRKEKVYYSCLYRLSQYCMERTPWWHEGVLSFMLAKNLLPS